MKKNALLIIACLPLWAFGEVVVYPGPPAEVLTGGDEVQVEGKNVDLYLARTADAPFADKYDYGGPYVFGNFDLSGPAEVRVTATRSLKNAVVRPERSGVRTRFEGEHTMLLTLPGPAKISIEPDAKKGPLLLFANPIEAKQPGPADPGVIYFGPGVRKPGKILLTNNQTLYLAGGAVVKAGVDIQGDNVRVCGRGILDGSDWPWKKGPAGVMFNINGRHIDVSGITIRGSWHWTLVAGWSTNVTIRNVKICNSRVQNDDGIDICNSQDVRIADCFIRSDDDCIALKGLEFAGANSNVEGITVEDCILWCDRARIFLLGHESRAKFMRQIALRNLDILHFAMTPFLFEPGEDMELSDVSVENVRVHAEGQSEFIRLRPTVNQYMRNKVPGHIRNVRFADIRISGTGDSSILIEGPDPAHQVRGVNFTNIVIEDEKVFSGSKCVQIGKNTELIHFE